MAKAMVIRGRSHVQVNRGQSHVQSNEPNEDKFQPMTAGGPQVFHLSQCIKKGPNSKWFVGQLFLIYKCWHILPALKKAKSDCALGFFRV